MHIYHKVASGYTVPCYHAFLYSLSAPAYRTHSPHGPPFVPYLRAFCTKGILLCDQNKISYTLFSKLVPGRYITGPLTVHPFKSPFAIHCQVLSQSIPSFSLTIWSTGVLPYISHSLVFTPFWYGICPFWSGIGYGFRANWGSIKTYLLFQ